ncbi:unnamed protein product [Schistosoma mattheei]|uniref:Uncharacterized protein n=1 Tax=Schistosoma mattheei TaxID=31246 RepID=A0A183NPE0_9TREM|nr:unnamed protein product [Schistosoma mattheei]
MTCNVRLKISNYTLVLYSNCQYKVSSYLTSKETLVHFEIKLKGQEIGPLDAQVNNLSKAIGLKQDEIGELEQQWLREQNELVVNINERDKLAESVTRINKQLSILTQKKLRIDNEIAIQGREKNDLKKELKHLQNDITRINTMIAKEKTTEECLDNENKLTEIDFIRSLKEKETEAANLQEKVDKALKDKEDLLSELVEVE